MFIVTQLLTFKQHDKSDRVENVLRCSDGKATTGNRGWRVDKTTAAAYVIEADLNRRCRQLSISDSSSDTPHGDQIRRTRARADEDQHRKNDGNLIGKVPSAKVSPIEGGEGRAHKTLEIFDGSLIGSSASHTHMQCQQRAWCGRLNWMECASPTHNSAQTSDHIGRVIDARLPVYMHGRRADWPRLLAYAWRSFPWHLLCA